MPAAILLGFVKSEALAGSLKHNPFTFGTLKITDAVVKMGGRRLPNFELNLDPQRQDTQLALYELFKALGLSLPPKILNRDTHTGALFLLGLDLSRSGIPENPLLNTDFDSSSLSISGNFDIPTTESYTSESLNKL